jgi:hypothetical protein
MNFRKKAEYPLNFILTQEELTYSAGYSLIFLFYFRSRRASSYLIHCFSDRCLLFF